MKGTLREFKKKVNERMNEQYKINKKYVNRVIGESLNVKDEENREKVSEIDIIEVR